MRPVYCLYLLFMLAGMFGCKSDDEPQPVDPLSLLPPPTQEARRTFGALFNGEAWTNENSLQVWGDFSGGDFLAIYMSSLKPSRNFALLINNFDPRTAEGYYELTDNIDSTNASGAINFYGAGESCEYEFQHTIGGYINITKFNGAQAIVSGEFEYFTVNSQCDTVKITHGRFDTTL